MAENKGAEAPSLDLDRIVRKVAKDWKDYGTPTMSQCAKIARDAIESYLREAAQPAPRPLCKHCGEAIESTGGKLYLWTHIDPDQQKCLVAQPADRVLARVNDDAWILQKAAEEDCADIRAGSVWEAQPAPRPQADGLEICDDCAGPNPAWFVVNEIWNRVIPDRVGMLCPVCFIVRAEKAGIECTGWKLVPENYRRSLKDEELETLQEIAQKYGVQWLPGNEELMRETYLHGEAEHTPCQPEESAITSHPQVLSGTPCVRGRRIPASVLVGEFRGGKSIAFLAKDYELEPSLIEAVLQQYLREFREAGVPQEEQKEKS